jgi:hypothetical protein
MRRCQLTALSIVVLLPSASIAQADIRTPPDSAHYDPFYRKYAEADGLPITASARVPDAAILAARDIITHMLARRPDVRRAMIEQHYRVTVMAQAESTLDVPEQRSWKKPALDDPRLTDGERANYARIAATTDREYWNKRARGMGGRLTSGTEENILGYPGTKYYGENIFVHEFSHGIMSGLRTADPALYAEILAAYNDAKAKGLYPRHYAINTAAEYWAEGTQWWFESNFDEVFDGHAMRGPEDLRAYDPELYSIFARVYPDHHIPADVYWAKHIPPARRR